MLKMTYNGIVIEGTREQILEKVYSMTRENVMNELLAKGVPTKVAKSTAETSAVATKNSISTALKLSGYTKE